MNKSKEIKEKKDESPKTEIELSVRQDVFKGIYSNMAIIRHTQNEFVIDFIFQLDGKGELVSRVIMSPEHMLLFKGAIETNLKLFEEKKTQH
jgi:hypothetical protein